MTQDGNEIFFKCKMTTPLQKLMQAFCNRQGVALNSVRFLFDGQRLSANQTPQEVRRHCLAAAPRERASTHGFRPSERPSPSDAGPIARDTALARPLLSPTSRARHVCRALLSQLEMEDGDVIDVMVEQQGGGA